MDQRPVNIGFALHSRPELQAAFRRATARAPNHAPKSPAWQTGPEEINAHLVQPGRLAKVVGFLRFATELPGNRKKDSSGDADGPERHTAAAQADLASQFDSSLAVMQLDMHRPIGMRRLVLIVLLLLLFIATGWHLLPSSEPDDPLHPRPSAIERTLADVLPRLNLANDWAMKVNLREMEWQIAEILRRMELEKNPTEEDRIRNLVYFDRR
jgi:hypothetical protein